MLGVKRDAEPEPEPVTEPLMEAEPDPDPDPVLEPTLTKNGVKAGSINTACAALLDFWDGGGWGVSESVEILFMVLGVGVLLSEEKERNVLCEEDFERICCEGFGGNDCEEEIGCEK